MKGRSTPGNCGVAARGALGQLLWDEGSQGPLYLPFDGMFGGSFIDIHGIYSPPLCFQMVWVKGTQMLAGC